MGAPHPGDDAATPTVAAVPRKVGASPEGDWEARALRLLAHGELEVRGRLVVSSNSALLCAVRLAAATDSMAPVEAAAIYKPIRFERPLWDFPDGTLAHREVAAFLVSRAAGWGIVPPTVLRDGPAGRGMVQLWIEADRRVDAWAMVEADDARLRPMAIFDAVVNNTDRKGGHIIPARIASDSTRRRGRDVHLFGVDHGVCFSADPKLRTVLWAWRGTPLSRAEIEVLARLRVELGGDLGTELGRLLSPYEVAATCDRVDALLASGSFPQPTADWPAVPWPPY